MEIIEKIQQLIEFISSTNFEDYEHGEFKMNHSFRHKKYDFILGKDYETENPILAIPILAEENKTEYVELELNAEQKYFVVGELYEAFEIRFRYERNKLIFPAIDSLIKNIFPKL